MAEAMTTKERVNERRRVQNRPEAKKLWQDLRKKEGAAKFHRTAMSKSDWEYIMAPKGKTKAAAASKVVKKRKVTKKKSPARKVTTPVAKKKVTRKKKWSWLTGWN